MARFDPRMAGGIRGRGGGIQRGKRPSPEISVIVPALNEAGTIRGLLQRIDSALAGRDFEIVVEDDGSEHDTAAHVLAGPAHWRVIQHDRRGGQSAAIHSGVVAAQGALIVTLDADGQNPPEEIPKLLETWSRHAGKAQLGLVAGQRVMGRTRAPICGPHARPTRSGVPRSRMERATPAAG